MVSKLVESSKQFALEENKNLSHSHIPSKQVTSQDVIDKQNMLKASEQIRDHVIEKSKLTSVFEGIAEHL